MGKKVDDLEHMMQTLATASADPNAVSVGDFAKAVQSLQAELQMLEAEVARLGGTVGKAFGPPTKRAARAKPMPEADVTAQPAATEA